MKKMQFNICIPKGHFDSDRVTIILIKQSIAFFTYTFQLRDIQMKVEATETLANFQKII